MPIVATMTVITLLRGRDGAPVPFFDAAQLREMLQDGLAGKDDDALERALPVVDALEVALDNYGSRVNESLAAYVSDSSAAYRRSDAIIDRVEPLDSQRTQILQEIIGYRRQLLNIVDAVSWDEVFG